MERFFVLRSRRSKKGVLLRTRVSEDGVVLRRWEVLRSSGSEERKKHFRSSERVLGRRSPSATWIKSSEPTKLRLFVTESKAPLLSFPEPKVVCGRILTCRIQNPDIPRAGRGSAAHGGAAGWGGAGQNGTPTVRFAQETTVPLTPQTIEENLPGRASGSTNKENPM